MENNINETITDSRVYELSYILVPTMTEDEATTKIDELKKSVATLGGSFISEETPYMRELAYEMIRVIKNANHRFNDGYFGWIKFEISPENLAVLDKQVRLDEDIVRYMTLKADRDVNIFTKRNPVVKSPRLTEDGEIVEAVDAIESETEEKTEDNVTSTEEK